MADTVEAIFKNDLQQEDFDQNGFVKFQLLEQDDIDLLRQYAEEKLGSKRQVIDFADSLNYYISIFDNDPDHKREVDELINSIVTPRIENVLNDYECFYSNFMIKYPGDEVLEAHQDFNLVDEELYTGFNLWSPLIDTNKQNGGLYMVAGSHRIKKLYRGPNIPFSFTSYQKEIASKGQLIEVGAGDCLLFDHRTIHFSGPNFTGSTRFAIQSVLKPAESTSLIYLYDEQNNRVLAKELTREFVIEKGFWSPDLAKLETIHTRKYTNPLESEIIHKLIND